MYKHIYTNATELVNKIRSGEYKQASASPEEDTPGLVRRRTDRMSALDTETEKEYDPMEAIVSYLNMFEGSSKLAPESSPSPRTRSNVLSKTDIAQDADFQQALEDFKKKYPGVTDHELYQVIKRESAFNPVAVNKDSGAAGLFQFIPDVAKELGYTTDQILKMTPAQQLGVYSEYLDRWGYSPDISLGLMQAAPAYRNAEPDVVVYKVGSKAWEQNPGWRESRDGPITVRSINRFYRGT